MPAPEVVFLHPPAVYDFRRLGCRHEHMVNSVASGPAFEYFPLGFLTMSAHLRAAGHDTRIVNLAARMANRRFDVPSFLRRLRPRAFGVSLHWLAHAQGALEIARLCKALHPDLPVIMGGLTASWFAGEIMDRCEQVDYLLQGDSVEQPLLELIECLGRGEPPAGVPNLAWRQDGEVRWNQRTHCPDKVEVSVNFRMLLGDMWRYRDFRGNLFTGKHWPRYFINMVPWCRGCRLQCAGCGGTNSALGRERLGVRPPETVAAEVASIQELSPHSVGIPGDLRQAQAEDYITALAARRLAKPIGFELFWPADRQYLTLLGTTSPTAHFSFSAESHDETLRRRWGRPFTNAEVEATISAAVDLGRSLRVFFMIGLPGQTAQSVHDTVDYIAGLYDRFARPPRPCFDAIISPLAPFLDPGSRAFLQPEEFGYRLRCRTLAEHAQAFLQPRWCDVLNYVSESLPPADLAVASYEAQEALLRLKLRYRLLAQRWVDRDLRMLERERAQQGL